MKKVDDRTLELRFMHGQSYGFNAYFAGDTVAFVKASTMERFAMATVTSVKRLTDRTVEVALDRPVPQALELDHDCVENMSCTPEVEIRNCHFTRTSTRGTLMTTPRKVVIAGNTYYKTGMSAILIEGDAEGWYESGPVKDVLIENNTFIDCAYNGGPENAVIALHPSNTVWMPTVPYTGMYASSATASNLPEIRCSMPRVRKDWYSRIMKWNCCQTRMLSKKNCLS